MKKNTDRVVIFIDGSNLLHSWMEMYPGERYDILKLRSKLTDGRNLVESCYYGSMRPDRINIESNFHNFLKRNNFTTIILPLKLRGKGYIEKGVDGALLTDLVSYAHIDKYDVAILVSGDQDYWTGLKKVKALGKKVEIAYFYSSDPDKPRLCRKLKKVANKFINLCEIKDEIKK